MSGEFTTGEGSIDTLHMSDTAGAEGDNKEVDGFDTDVPGVKAHDQVSIGTERFPVFDVEKNEFHQNMQWGRKRLRFKTGSKAQEYMQKSRYNRPFYIRYTDTAGKKFVRKIKG